MNGHRARTSWQTSLILGAVAALAACGPPPGTNGTNATGGTDGEAHEAYAFDDPECPHDWIWKSPVKSGIETFTGGRDDIPEYNDCQRFLVGSAAAPAYDSVFAAFAWGRLDVDHDSAAVLIRAFGEYQRLGLVPGWNCLKLRRGASEWRAFMFPIDQPGSCSGALPTDTLQLPVVRRSSFDDGREYQPQDVPPVVRWGFDPVEWQQYVITRCGVGTCYVGIDNIRVAELPNILQEIDERVRGTRVVTVAGWHDVQFLAERPAASPIRPVTPPLEAAVIPDLQLGARSMAEFRQGWVPVAQVALAARHPDYINKVNFGSTAGAPLNRIHACIDDGTGNCPGLPDDMIDRCRELDAAIRDIQRARGDTTVMRWRTRHTSSFDATTYHCIKYFPLDPEDDNLIVPGTVRWRWQAHDETFWFRCGTACCKGP